MFLRLCDLSTVCHIIYILCVCMFSSVPVAWRTDFVAESKEAEAKMNSLKTWIQNNEFKVTEKWVLYICFALHNEEWHWNCIYYLCPASYSLSYPCEWGGVVDGKPYVKGLEDFGRAALEDIWEAVQQLFVEVRVSLKQMKRIVFICSTLWEPLTVWNNNWKINQLNDE